MKTVADWNNCLCSSCQSIRFVAQKRSVLVTCEQIVCISVYLCEQVEVTCEPMHTRGAFKEASSFVIFSVTALPRALYVKFPISLYPSYRLYRILGILYRYAGYISVKYTAVHKLTHFEWSRRVSGPYNATNAATCKSIN
jgi:hypothetical protein